MRPTNSIVHSLSPSLKNTAGLGLGGSQSGTSVSASKLFLCNSSANKSRKKCHSGAQVVLDHPESERSSKASSLRRVAVQQYRAGDEMINTVLTFSEYSMASYGFTSSGEICITAPGCCRVLSPARILARILAGQYQWRWQVDFSQRRSRSPSIPQPGCQTRGPGRGRRRRAD
jgi:hypothetical protein